MFPMVIPPLPVLRRIGICTCLERISLNWGKQMNELTFLLGEVCDFAKQV
jgi:hypothetical protein